MLKIENVTLDFGNIRLYSNLNLSFNLGQRVLWTGPSGIGKSALAKIISGYHFPTTGTVSLNEFVISSPNSMISYISQEDDLFFWQTTKEHIDFLNSQPFPNKITVTDIKLFGLNDALDLYPSELSGGMKRRLQLLRSLCFNSRVVILDETLSALDSKTRNNILTTMDKIWEKNNTLVICITHLNDEFLMKYFKEKLVFPLS